MRPLSDPVGNERVEEAGTNSEGPSDNLETDPRVSVAVTVTERPVRLSEFYEEYAPSVAEVDPSFEFLFVLEPWYREYAESLDALISAGEPIRVLHASRTMSEADMLKLAERHCRGRVVLTMPAYYRVVSDSIPALINELTPDTDLVMARRWPRQDSWFNRLQTRVFHFLAGSAGGSRVHDTGCGVRVIRRDVLRQIPLYGDFFRFLPILAGQQGFSVREVDCGQHPEDVETRLYSPIVYLRRLIDLLGLFFLARFTYKPLRFFGLVGSAVALPGMVILAVLFVQRLGGQGLADRPLLLLGVLLTSLGVQAIALGLIGEIIVHFQASRGGLYRLREDPSE